MSVCICAVKLPIKITHKIQQEELLKEPIGLHVSCYNGQSLVLRMAHIYQMKSVIHATLKLHNAGFVCNYSVL